jgi:ribosomal protein S12 methylthiotransferase accessory factor YcaO
MNLAPIKYAQVESVAGGPIARIETGVQRIGEATYYQANAWLSTELGLEQEPLKMFSTASGTGTDRSQLLARYKAISEAMERWAYRYLARSGDTSQYGFDIEPSTTGMAAFPGLFARQSRKRAMLEAIERYCVANWWAGRLAAQQAEHAKHGDRQFIRIQNPLSSDAVILSWKEYEPNLYAYGTAAAKTAKAASHQAMIEMERSAAALAQYRKGVSDLSIESVKWMNNYAERQILYYSLPQGHRIFQDRLSLRPSSRKGNRTKPIIDCLIPGPWQKYATVWRVLFPMDRGHQDNSLEANFIC